MTLDEAVETCRLLCLARFQDFYSLPRGERILQVMAVLADVLKVQESGGPNHGPFVKQMLQHTGLNEGPSWCASAIAFSALVAKADVGPTGEKANDARVFKWEEWAIAQKRQRNKPQRGRLCYMKKTASSGHIGIVVRILANGDIESIEGNTSPPKGTGSQSDGDGLYRRIRKPSFWKAYIELDSPAD